MSEEITYDMIRERDHYQARCVAAVDRIEREAGKGTDAAGAVVSIILPVDSWRSIRAMLQQEPRHDATHPARVAATADAP